MPVQMFARVPPKIFSAVKAQAAFNKYLHEFADDFQSIMQEYPAARPWSSRPPKRGPRAGGKRTGAYGRGWAAAPSYTKQSVTITNSVGYASAVGGARSQSPGQAHWLGERGWNSIEDIGPAVAKRHLANLGKALLNFKS